MMPVLNAGSSGQGREYAAKNANFAFTVVGGPEDGAQIVQQVTAQAKNDYNRDMGVFTLGHVVCKPTQKEAEEFLHYYADEHACLLYTSPSPRDRTRSRMPSSA